MLLLLFLLPKPCVHKQLIFGQVFAVFCIKNVEELCDLRRAFNAQ